MVNLAAIWGLGQERGYEALSKEARSVVVSARLKRTGYRGVVDVVYGGEVPKMVEKEDKGKTAQMNQGAKKRKPEDDGSSAGTGADGQQISKREKKRRAKMAREAEVKTDVAS